MGVRDLSNVIKKHAASAVTYHPTLASFTGKTFAIDANLMTTKFFFVASTPASPSLPSDLPNPITASIIQAWYRLLRSLRAHSIKPIVVFDGKSRLPAKALENARRRERRAVQRRRGEAERIRGERFAMLDQVWRDVGVGRRAEVARAFAEEVLKREREDVREGAMVREVRPDLVPLPPSPAWEAEELEDEFIPDSTLPSSQTPPLYVRPLPSTLEPISSDSKSTPSVPMDPAPPPTPAPKAVIIDSTPPPALPDLLEPGYSQIDALLSIYDAHTTDIDNPVYSKNQILVTSREKLFFDRLRVGTAPEITAGVLPPKLREDTEAPTQDIDDFEEVDESEVMIEGMRERSSVLEASHRKRSQGIPYGVFEEVQRLIEHLGVPIIQPSPTEPHEAEGICASLCQAGIADYVVSEDTDVVIYGAPLLRKITTKKSEGQDGRTSMNVLDPIKLREELGLSKEEMVDFALLCGTDFTERIPKIGPINALKLIKKHHSIETLLEDHTPLRGSDHSTYLNTVAVARSIFLDLPPLPSSDVLSGQAPSPELEAILTQWGVEGRVPPEARRSEVTDDVDVDDGSDLFDESEDSVEYGFEDEMEALMFEKDLAELHLEDRHLHDLGERYADQV